MGEVLESIISKLKDLSIVNESQVLVAGQECYDGIPLDRLKDAPYEAGKGYPDKIGKFPFSSAPGMFERVLFPEFKSEDSFFGMIADDYSTKIMKTEWPWQTKTELEHLRIVWFYAGRRRVIRIARIEKIIFIVTSIVTQLILTVKHYSRNYD